MNRSNPGNKRKKSTETQREREYCALKPEENVDEFGILMRQIHELADIEFPNTAVCEVPLILSEDTKQRILNSGKSTEELAEIFVKSIDEINHGSVQRLDTLVRMRLLNT